MSTQTVSVPAGSLAFSLLAPTLSILHEIPLKTMAFTFGTIILIKSQPVPAGSLTLSTQTPTLSQMTPAYQEIQPDVDSVYIELGA